MNLYQVVQFKSALVELFILSAGYYFLRTALISGVAVCFLASSAKANARRIYRLPVEMPQFLSELKAGTLILIIDASAVTLLIHYNWFRHVEGSLALNLATFSGIFVWFEIWFYVTHRLLHRRAFFFIHAQHHIAKVASPLTAISFSFLERTILLVGGIGLPAIVSHWVPMSFTAYAAYFTLNYVLNVYGHMNVEVLPPEVIKNSAGAALNSTTYHALHHARFQGHFGLFTPYLDRWFGTRFGDYERVHAEAYEGRGLTQLGMKFSNAQA
jgi:Delta7-sterol 5-desaturase